MSVLVTGATGTVGRSVVARLARSGLAVKAMARRPGRVEFPSGVIPVAADLDDRGAVRAALAEVDRVFLLTTGPQGPRQDRIVAEAAALAGVDHVVKLSVLGISEGADDPITRWHREGEEAVQQSGLAHSFLRAGGFMSNTLAWASAIAEYGTVETPFADLPFAAIAPEDIADVAAALLTGRPSGGTNYALAGPETITPREQAAVLADLLDTAVRVVDLDPDRARERMVGYGMPPETATAVLATLAGPAHGYGRTPTKDVESVTGKPATTFREWAAAHIAEFHDPAPAW
ncbi:NAD(P)H-binding protein [Nocardia sp. BMG111209]|uniref:NAD(P)H-binding protein n=1 Tax=Nocardia sp. BMG111209 TaxID=1160137 RepID=UPI00037808DE|nr:NAD(P)H-binding protein [Nocardia sp. BMG111209]